MRTIIILAYLGFVIGCTSEGVHEQSTGIDAGLDGGLTAHVPPFRGPAPFDDPDAGLTNVDGASAVDATVEIDTQAALDTTPVSCIQQAINAGYANNASMGDKYYFSCDLCLAPAVDDAGGTIHTDAGNWDSVMVSIAGSCKRIFDCIRDHWPCDVTCTNKCGNVDSSTMTCVRNILLPWCGAL